MECAFSCVVVAGTDLQHSVWLCQYPARIKCPLHISLCIHHGDYDSSTPVGGAILAGAMQRTAYAIIRYWYAGSIKSRHRGSASPPRFHPRYCLARKPRKSPSTLSAFAMFDQVSSGGAPATNRHNPYSINPGLLDPRRRGLNGSCMSGEFLLLVVNPAPQPLPKTPVSNQNFKLRTRGAAVEPPDI